MGRERWAVSLTRGSWSASVVATRGVVWWHAVQLGWVWQVAQVWMEARAIPAWVRSKSVCRWVAGAVAEIRMAVPRGSGATAAMLGTSAPAIWHSAQKSRA